MRFWIGDSGNWNDTAHWSTSSGGAGGASVPTASDDVVFDSNSFSGSGFTVNLPVANHHAKGLDFSAVIDDFNLQWQTGATLAVAGDLTLSTHVNITLVGGGPGLLEMNGGTTQNLTTNGCPITPNIFFAILGNSTIVDQQDNINFFQIDIGGSTDSPVFNTNNHVITADFLGVDSGTFHAGSSVLNINQELNTDNVSPTAVFDAGTSTIIFGSGGILSFDEPTQALYDVQLVAGTLEIDGNTTLQFHDLTLNSDTQVNFLHDTIYTVTGTFAYNGLTGLPVVLRSTSSGHTYEIDAAIASGQYADVQDSVAGGVASPFDDTIGGVDSGNNTGWTFSAGAFPQIINVGNITFDTASIQLDLPPGLSFDEMGIVFDTFPDPTITGGSPFVDIFGVIGPYFVDISSLIPGETYYIRVFTRIGSTYTYGVTIVITVPVVSPLTTIATDNLVSKYQFELFDQSGDLIADLSGYITNRQFTIERNRAEEIDFSIPLTTFAQLAKDLALDPNQLLQTGIQEIRVRRSGQPIVAGQITYWETDFSDPTNPVINVKAMGWLNLFTYRVFSGEYDGDDAAFIARDIITQTQALPLGDFGITLGSNVTGANVYAQKIFENQSISDILIAFSEEENGFDFQFTWDKVYNMFLPGQGAYRQDIIFTYPGNTTNIVVSSDSTQIVNSLLARGKGNADANISTIIEDTPSQEIYGLRTAVKDYPDLDDDQLVTTATSEVAFYRFPLELHSIYYDGSQPNVPPVGSYNVGDKIRVLVQNLPLIDTLNDFFTIDKITVTLDNNDVEVVQLDVNNNITF
jgi:hypothetical protein